ncbi:MAG TPA: aminotransferase class IV, partial [Gammaproteobacteria bacterium]|nr:aminotransferase class IV [Gammaproteobacteria bacterium]
RHGAVTRIVSTHPPPDYPPSFYTDGVAVRVCRTRLACRHPLAGLKHLNRLEQVMARGEWDDPDVPEGLMLDHDDHLIEGTMSNVFLVDGDQLITPDVSGSGVAGIMRGLILELAPDLAMTPVVRPVFVTELGTAGEVFVCNSLIGLWPVKAVDGDRRLRPGPATRRLAETVAASSGLG